MKRPRREGRFWIRVSEQDKAALERLAVARDVPASQIVREAIKQAVAEGGQRTRRT